eukprot:403344901
MLTTSTPNSITKLQEHLSLNQLMIKRQQLRQSSNSLRKQSIIKSPNQIFRSPRYFEGKDKLIERSNIININTDQKHQSVLGHHKNQQQNEIHQSSFNNQQRQNRDHNNIDLNNINRIQVTLAGITGSDSGRFYFIKNLSKQSSTPGQNQHKSDFKQSQDKSPMMSAIKNQTRHNEVNKHPKYSSRLQTSNINETNKSVLSFDHSQQAQQLKFQAKQSAPSTQDKFDTSPLQLKSKAKSSNIHQYSLSKTPLIRVSMMSPDLKIQNQTATKHHKSLFKDNLQKEIKQHSAAFSYKTLMTTKKTKKSSQSKINLIQRQKAREKQKQEFFLESIADPKDFEKDIQRSEIDEEMTQIRDSYYLNDKLIYSTNSQKRRISNDYKQADDLNKGESDLYSRVSIFNDSSSIHIADQNRNKLQNKNYEDENLETMNSIVSKSLVVTKISMLNANLNGCQLPYDPVKVQIETYNDSVSPFRFQRGKHNSDYLDEKYIKSPPMTSNMRKQSEPLNGGSSNSVDEESDYLENIHTKRFDTEVSLKTNKRNKHNKNSRTGRKPIVKVDMDLESNQIHLIQAVPLSSKKKQKSIDRSILKRSLSQSAKSLLTKANQLKEDTQSFSPKPEKKRHVTTLWKVIDLKM